MSDALQLILEDADGTQLETSCTRFAAVSYTHLTLPTNREV